VYKLKMKYWRLIQEKAGRRQVEKVQRSLRMVGWLFAVATPFWLFAGRGQAKT